MCMEGESWPQCSALKVVSGMKKMQISYQGTSGKICLAFDDLGPKRRKLLKNW